MSNTMKLSRQTEKGGRGGGERRGMRERGDEGGRVGGGEGEEHSFT